MYLKLLLNFLDTQHIAYLHIIHMDYGQRPYITTMCFRWSVVLTKKLKRGTWNQFVWPFDFYSFPQVQIYGVIIDGRKEWGGMI